MVSANRERDPSPVFPLGLSYLLGPLARAGHFVRLLDLCFEEDVPAAVVRALDEARPAVVLVSIRNLDNVTWPVSRSYVDGVREVVGLCRDRAVVVLGGSGFSLEPRALLAATGAHCGVVGEGEEVVPRLLERIEAGIYLEEDTLTLEPEGAARLAAEPGRIMALMEKAAQRGWTSSRPRR